MNENMIYQEIVKRLLRLTYKESDLGFDYPVIRDYIYLKDSSYISLQASKFHYCYPRQNQKDGKYTDVELKIFKSENPNYENDIVYLRDYKCDSLNDGSIFANVPIEMVGKLIISHGGLNSGFIGSLFNRGDFIKALEDIKLTIKNNVYFIDNSNFRDIIIKKDSIFVIEDFKMGETLISISSTGINNLNHSVFIQNKYIDSKYLLNFEKIIVK